MDTHVHFFDMGNPEVRYGWLEEEGDDDPSFPLGAMRSRRYWADDFLNETRLQGVGKVVHAENAVGTPDPVLETRWLQAFAERLGAPQGIVAGLDLTRDDAAVQLARHAESANLRGIRDFRFDDYLADPLWERGVTAMEERGGLVLCVMPPPERAAIARDLALRHPGLTFCIDHAGYPVERGDEYFSRWRHGMEVLAEARNAVVKISGLAMFDHRWTVESLRPWVLGCIEAFRPDRACFGTNWPLDRLWSSYGDVVGAYREIVSSFPLPVQSALLAGNAERIFRI